MDEVRVESIRRKALRAETRLEGLSGGAAIGSAPESIPLASPLDIRNSPQLAADLRGVGLLSVPRQELYDQVQSGPTNMLSVTA